LFHYKKLQWNWYMGTRIPMAVTECICILHTKIVGIYVHNKISRLLLIYLHSYMYMYAGGTVMGCYIKEYSDCAWKCKLRTCDASVVCSLKQCAVRILIYELCSVVYVYKWMLYLCLVYKWMIYVYMYTSECCICVWYTSDWYMYV